MVVARVWERGKWEVTANEYEASFWGDGVFWNWIIVMATHLVNILPNRIL